MCWRLTKKFFQEIPRKERRKLATGKKKKQQPNKAAIASEVPKGDFNCIPHNS